MSLYGMENFAYGNVAATFDNSQTTLSMSTGHTARFTTFPCMAVLFNITDHNTPHEAFYEPVTPDAEIIEIVSKSGDTFDVIKRGQDGTSAISTTAGKTYRVAVIASRSQWLKVCRAPPDGSAPFDAILAGIAGAVSEGLMRIVKDVPNEDTVVSIQGSDGVSDKTALWLGDIANPDDVKIERLPAATRTLQLLFNALTIMSVEDTGAIGFNTTPTGAVPGVDFGDPVQFDRMIGFSDPNFTLVSDAVTINSNIAKIAAEGGGADDLVTLNHTAHFGSRVIVILKMSTSGGTTSVTVKSTGNIGLLAGDYVMNASNKYIALMQDGSNWDELWRT